MTNEPYSKCPSCRGTLTFWRSKTVGEHTYRIDSCTECGYSFVNPRPSFDFLMEYYSSYGHSHDEVIRSAPSFEKVMESEKANPNSTLDAKRIVATLNKLGLSGGGRTFLDVGCGYGFFSKAAIQAGFQVTAIELAEQERAIARKNCGIVAQSCSYESFSNEAVLFDVVLMSQILEHALDVNQWLKKTREMMNDSGVLVIALPNFNSIFRRILQENESFISPPAHLNFFSPKSLSNLLQRHGYIVEETQWVSRIPSTSFERRLPSFAKPLLPVIQGASEAALKCIDTLHMGMIINVYARKI